ncbi:hypothetical protein HS1genome_2140 [Sulfodiicoccus acidiphilus]|uniref:Glycosyltransferase 2-like domain-containing protein n=1 Tax=Sulfodiicoccus acidiphilus TaxID=1670455 RepID=A0A348B6E9_9CREN|nr:glycosyltransferase family 2 protein [Sulfodiicoccus acidiphilus]BBD73751.1 hypothetical protein HS1genome_2140 [Sulfodiicoccus acidiphilus]GGT98075.1 hypothetical protein GCM10007116_14560 [Sulfodiicoccus acidiphilus]
MKISVIVTAYKRREYVRYAVQSLKEQSHAPDEVVLVTDEGFSVNDIDVKVIVSKDERAGAFMATGIVHTSGDVICFLDDDDMFSLEKLRTVKEVFGDSNVGFLYNSRVKIDEMGRVIGEDVVESRRFKRKNRDEVCSMFKMKMFFNSSSMCIRREVVQSRLDDLSRITKLVDNYFLYSAIDSSFDVVSDSRPLTYYRVHRSSSRHVGHSKSETLKERGKYFQLASGDVPTTLSREEARMVANCSSEMARLQWHLYLGEVNKRDLSRLAYVLSCCSFSAPSKAKISLGILLGLLAPSIGQEFAYLTTRREVPLF